VCYINGDISFVSDDRVDICPCCQLDVYTCRGKTFKIHVDSGTFHEQNCRDLIESDPLKAMLELSHADYDQYFLRDVKIIDSRLILKVQCLIKLKRYEEALFQVTLVAEDVDTSHSQVHTVPEIYRLGRESPVTLPSHETPTSVKKSMDYSLDLRSPEKVVVKRLKKAIKSEDCILLQNGYVDLSNQTDILIVSYGSTNEVTNRVSIQRENVLIRHTASEVGIQSGRSIKPMSNDRKFFSFDLGTCPFNLLA
jgi:hypothetical protein